MEFNAFQDSITILWNKLNHERVNAEPLYTAGTVASATSEQELHVQQTSFPDLERFDSSSGKLSVTN
jgi:hypothetical protein